MSSGACDVCGTTATLEDGLCPDCRLFQSAAKETEQENSSSADLRRPFLEAFESASAEPEERGPVPTEVDTIRKNRPESATGKFTLVEKVGSGGVGDVWKAWDHPLHRWVALKFLKNEEEIDVQRFEREARTVGQLTHPHIAPVFEVGKLEGHSYIAMQFVEGSTLQEFIGREERLVAALIRDTALALQYAHEKGIVHRDIKPANIMVEELGSLSGGDTPSRLNSIGYHVFVMDFGLAKQVESDSSITRVNSVLGTPAYMSPEQVQGKNDTLDHHTDIYSLGVTLYEMFTGEVPFQASSTYDLFKMIDGMEPKSPRSFKPKLDRDLETIVLKCMEKDPQRRYESAQELADELTRWLDGDAILSHPPSTVYRVKKFVFKRKLLVSIVAMAIFSVCGLSGFLLIEQSKKRSAEEEWIEAEENRRIAEAAVVKAKKKKLDVLRRETRYRLDTLLRLRRSGSREGIEEDVKQIELSCDDVLREYPNLAEPHYIKGRMFRAVLQEDRALEEQKEAVRLDPKFVLARYERVVLEVQRYRHRLREFEEKMRRKILERVLRSTSERSGQGGEALVEKKALELQRRRLKIQLSELEGFVPEERVGFSQGKLACARGLWSWITGDLPGAKRSLEEAVQTEKFLEEAYEALATIEMDARRYSEAVKWWSRGASIDRGYAPYFEGRGFAYASWAQSQGGEESRKNYKASLLDFDKALSLRNRVETWLMRGLSRQFLAVAIVRERGKAGDLFQEALSDFSQAVEMEPGEVEPLISRARLQRVGAYMGLLPDFNGMYRSAIRDLESALELDSNRAGIWSDLGASQVEYGLYLVDQKEDPTFFYEEARENYSKSIGLAPQWEETWLRLGLALTHWGNFLFESGKDPIPLWKKGEDALSESIQLDPDWAEPLLRRGAVRGHIGSYWRTKMIARSREKVPEGEESKKVAVPDEENPEKPLGLAIRDYTKFLKREPNRIEGWWWRGGALYNLAGSYLFFEKEFKETYRKAKADFEKALSMNPSDNRELKMLIQNCEGAINK